MFNVVHSTNPPQVAELLPLLLQNMDDRAIFMADVEGRILSWAPGVKQLLGYEADDFIGQPVDMLLPIDDRGAGYDERQQAISAGRIEVERLYLRQDGAQFWGRQQVIALRDGDVLRGFAFMLRDISEQKFAQERLQASEAQLSIIFAEAAVGLSEISLEGRFLRVNNELCRMLGRSRAELLDLGVVEVTHPDDIPRSFVALGHLLSTNEPVSLDKRYVRPDGTLTWANSSLTRLSNEHGDGTVLVVTVDLTGRKQAEDALRQAHDQLEARIKARTAELSAANEARGRLLHQLVSAQEEERRRIARELHDQLGQSLVALGMGLESLLAHPTPDETQPSGEPTELQTRLGTLHNVTQGLMDQVHALAWQLRPAELDELGLEVALRQVVTQWAQTNGVPADFIAAPAPHSTQPSIEIEVTLYRVTQECLTNVTRHAGASNVSVVLKQSAHEVAVIIEDDGHGFDLDAAQTNAAKRLGVVGMRERLEIVGGTLTIESAPGSGTTVYARVPLAPQNDT